MSQSLFSDDLLSFIDEWKNKPGNLIMVAGWVTAFAMLAIGVWSFFRSKDKFILYI